MDNYNNNNFNQDGNFNNTNFNNQNQVGGFNNQAANPDPNNEWNFNITSDEMDSDFVLLPPGDYQYTITNFEKARHTPKGPGKIDRPCPKVILHLRIKSAEGKDVNVKSNLFIHPACAFGIGAFFRSIGHIQKGEDLNPGSVDWNRVIGSTGTCKIKHREYNNNKYNEVDRFLEPSDNSSQQNMQGSRFMANDMPPSTQNATNMQNQQQVPQGGGDITDDIPF
ncbi:hypothetical protein AAEX28_04030 [Lentisphaerota bacterium WC36G]|nr:hypothetical protein LJT99_06900 [Lentisphaerae bacterium WC36]